MAGENDIAKTARAIKELAEAVPIYSDAVQPTAKELGSALAPAGKEIGRTVTAAAKAVNIALAPLHGMVWGWSKIEEIVLPELGRRFEAKLKKLSTPKPNVAVPALEALRYTGSDPTLRDMYVSLLAASMDAEKAHKAHPAFVEVIKQLTPDEARILKLLAVRKELPVVSVWKNVADDRGTLIHIEVLRNFSHIAEQAGCEHVTLVTAYLDNIQRPGLVAITTESTVPGAMVYEPLADDERVRACRQAVESEGYHNTLREGSVIITDFGRQFCAACMDGVSAV